MKTIIGMSFIIGTVLVSQLSFGSGNINVAVSSVEAKKAVVELSSPSQTMVEISILNEDGDQVFSKQMNQVGREFVQKYDFSRLENGTYLMKVKTNSGSKEQEISVNPSGIQFGQVITKTDPFFNYRDNRLVVSFLNHQKESTSLHLYDKDQLLWSSESDYSAVINKGFDLSKLERGNYHLVLSSGNDVYDYVFERE